MLFSLQQHLRLIPEQDADVRLGNERTQKPATGMVAARQSMHFACKQVEYVAIADDDPSAVRLAP